MGSFLWCLDHFISSPSADRIHGRPWIICPEMIFSFFFKEKPGKTRYGASLLSGRIVPGGWIGLRSKKKERKKNEPWNSDRTDNEENCFWFGLSRMRWMCSRPDPMKNPSTCFPRLESLVKTKTSIAQQKEKTRSARRSVPIRWEREWIERRPSCSAEETGTGPCTAVRTSADQRRPAPTIIHRRIQKATRTAPAAVDGAGRARISNKWAPINQIKQPTKSWEEKDEEKQ